MKTSSLLAVLAVIPCLAFAETSPSTVIPPYVVNQLSVMTGKLNLSQSQQDRIRPILVAEYNKKQSIEGSTLSGKQKHDQEFANHRAALQKIKAIFTPEQLAQIEREQDSHEASSTSARN